MMKAIVSCPGCGTRYSIQGEFAGRTIKCKTCNALFQVRAVENPVAPTTGQTTPPSPASPHVPPVPAADSLASATGGAASSQAVSQGGQPAAATKACPFCGGTILAAAKKCKHCGEWLDRSMPAPRTMVPGPAGLDGSRLKPHRGGQILGMAIFGLFCFGIILGPAAFAMAIWDLREMSQGRMDPSGKGLTIAGQIVGLIVAILSVIGMFVIFSGGLNHLPR